MINIGPEYQPWEQDAISYAEQARTLFLGHKRARQQFFQELYDYGLWRDVDAAPVANLQPTAPGALQWAKYVRTVFTHCLNGQKADGADPCSVLTQDDLPNTNEISDWFHLFSQRQVLTANGFDHRILPSNRGQARAMASAVSRCAPEQREGRMIRIMQEYERQSAIEIGSKVVVKDAEDFQRLVASFEEKHGREPDGGERLRMLLQTDSIKTDREVVVTPTAERIRGIGQYLEELHTRHVPLREPRWRVLVPDDFPAQAGLEKQLQALYDALAGQSDIPKPVKKAAGRLLKTFRDDRWVVMNLTEVKNEKPFIELFGITYGFWAKFQEDPMHPQDSFPVLGVKRLDDGKLGHGDGPDERSGIVRLYPSWHVLTAQLRREMLDSAIIREWTAKRTVAKVFRSQGEAERVAADCGGAAVPLSDYQRSPRQAWLDWFEGPSSEGLF